MIINFKKQIHNIIVFDKNVKRMWTLVTNVSLLNLLSWQPDGVTGNLLYFNLKLFDLSKSIVCNIRSLGHQVVYDKGVLKF